MNTPAQKPAPLWDWPTRVLHWALALCVVLNLFFLESGEDAHQWVGYAALAIITLRLIWGFVGGLPSRWKSFPVHPLSIWRFLRGGLKEDLYQEKHNPLASLVYLTLWLLILALGMSGWMMSWDRYWGEEWLEELHSNFSTAVEILIIVHLLGLIADSIRNRRHTWLGMIRGRR